jgi:hypothetical protein
MMGPQADIITDNEQQQVDTHSAALNSIAMFNGHDTVYPCDIYTCTYRKTPKRAEIG